MSEFLYNINYIVLFTGTIGIVLFSWFLSIRYGRYHGIARFFAFESVFILFMLNYRVWFIDPFSAHQVFSWIILIFSAYIAITGFLLLKRKGLPDDTNFENTSVIVKTGIYKFIRHPLYLSVFLLGTGIVLKKPNEIQLCLGLINLIAIWFTARIEEKEMISKFGEDYRNYIKETRMFIPYIL